MFDLINGLPVRPLVVHAVVVLLPLTVVGVLILAVRPAWRRPYGPVLLALAAVGTVLIPVATSSGEELERHVGDPGRHAQLGDQRIWFALPLSVLLTAMVLLAFRTQPDLGGATGSSRGSALGIAITALAVVAALATGVQVYRVGDSGARAAWGDQVTSTTAP